MRHAVRLLTAAALVVGLGGLTATAQPRSGFGVMGGGGPALLVASKTVQAELKVTDQQAAKLKDWSKEYHAKQVAMRQKAMQDLQGLQPKELSQKFAEIEIAAHKEAYRQLGDILKPEQVKRLRQIEVQVNGGGAWRRLDVWEALKFTDEQQKKMREIEVSGAKEFQALRQEYGVEPVPGQRPATLDAQKQKEFDTKLAAIRKDSNDKVTAMLTDEQKKAWKGLTGDPVDVDRISREVEAIVRPGRPGGGVTAVAQPQPVGDRPDLLIDNKVVRAELKVTDEQAAKLRDWSREGRVKALGEWRQKWEAAMRAVPPQEQFQKGRELEGELNEAMYQHLGGILSPGQVKRLRQIDLQLLGAQAYDRPDVAAALKLTADQKAGLRRIQRDRLVEVGKVREEYWPRRQPGQPPRVVDLDSDKWKEFRGKQDAITREADRKSAAMLTEEQRKAWKELAGEPVDVDTIRQQMRAASQPKKKDG